MARTRGAACWGLGSAVSKRGGPHSQYTKCAAWVVYDARVDDQLRGKAKHAAEEIVRLLHCDTHRVNGLRRLGLKGTELERAQATTIRLRLLKIGAQVRITVRKVWLSMASSYPLQQLFGQVHQNLRPAVALGG